MSVREACVRTLPSLPDLATEPWSGARFWTGQAGLPRELGLRPAANSMAEGAGARVVRLTGVRVLAQVTPLAAKLSGGAIGLAGRCPAALMAGHIVRCCG